ncbi:MAG TPA: O-antigen ligase family protein [Longimicrobiales bacterium]|nr:O-antigen ligase family protein [Longimicrobiales bacterium]
MTAGAIAHPGAEAASGVAGPAGRRLFVLTLLAWAVSPAVGFRPALAVLMLAGFACMIVGLRRPGTGLAGIALLATLDPLMNAVFFSGGGLPWNTLNYWLLFVSLAFAPLLLRGGEVSVRLLQAFAGFLALGLLATPDLLRGVQDLFGLCAFFGLYVYFTREGLGSEDRLWAGIVGGAAGAAGGLPYFALQAQLPRINPNAWAFFPLTALFAIALAYPFAASARHRVLLWVLAAANLVWTFLSASRGGLLGALCCVAFLAVLTRGGWYRAALALGLGLVVILALGRVSPRLATLEEHAVGRVRLLFDPHARITDRTSHRSELVVGGWHIFLEHPFGVGTGGFATTWRELGRREGASRWRLGRQVDAHAGWVKILAENGAVGMLLFAVFVGSFAVVGWRRPDRVLRGLGLLATAALTLGFMTTEYQSKGLWFLAAGVASLLAPAAPAPWREWRR